MTAVLDQDDIESGLKRKGFQQSNNDHRYYILYFNGKKEAATYLSHGKNQDISPSLLSLMAKELGINIHEFTDLINCPLSTENYLAKKKERLASRLRIMKRG